MTDYDLRAAAERLDGRNLADYQGPTGDDTDMRAGIVLARAWLRDNPADSDELVSDHWEQLRDGLLTKVAHAKGVAVESIERFNRQSPYSAGDELYQMAHAVTVLADATAEAIRRMP